PPPPPPEKPQEKEVPDKNAFVDKQKVEAKAVPTVTPPPAKAIAKVEPPKPTVPSKAELEAAAKKAAEEAKAKKTAEEAAKKLADEAKKKAAEEAALKKAADEAAKKAAAEAAAKEKAAKARDEQILAAVKRASETQSGEKGGGTGSKAGAAPGGPISVGPGEGAGGQPFGLDYVLYLGQLESRIKDSWAWAGADNALEAVVRFSIMPSGEIVDVRITKTSSDRGFDSSVERAVRAISPMPPPPAQYRDQFGDVEYTFNAKALQK
ncbi:MAG TPA: cell envelope integrity protein TolA, partial [Candidatus Acidoferrales bacterium]|nr:cell envelope integrity protein TolA [Candidatus Acidoferrales bacterium]